MTVADRFQTLFERITPSDAEAAAYARHIEIVKGKIKAAIPDAQVRTIGSYSRGTAIRGSDVDLLAILPKKFVWWGDHRRSPSRVLANLKDTVRERLPTSHARKDGQALVVRFSDGTSIDIVPGSFDGPSSQKPSRPTYVIPHAGDTWRSTSPDGHNLYLKNANADAGGKLRGAARALKYWKAERALSLQSFYVEMLLASTGVCTGFKSHASVFALALRALRDHGCRSIADPIGISTRISAASTDAKRVALVDAVRRSLAHAERALAAEEARQLSEAYQCWDRAFAGHFPKG